MALVHPLHAWVDALEMLLAPQPDITVVAAHTTPDWVRPAISSGDADLLLISIDDPSLDGSSAVRSLRGAHPGVAVVAISDSKDPAKLSTAVRAGVRGWLSQAASSEHLTRVIRGVADGETWFPPDLLTTLLDSLLAAEEQRQRESALLAPLSAREIEVLWCLTRGLSRQQIAERYVLSPHTVRTHINNVLRKLDVHSTLAAVSIARQIGLSDHFPDQPLG